MDLPNPGITLGPPALQVDSLPIELSEKPLVFPYLLLNLSLGSLYLYYFCGMLFFGYIFLQILCGSKNTAKLKIHMIISDNL